MAPLGSGGNAAELTPYVLPIKFCPILTATWARTPTPASNRQRTNAPVHRLELLRDKFIKAYNILLPIPDLSNFPTQTAARQVRPCGSTMTEKNDRAIRNRRRSAVTIQKILPSPDGWQDYWERAGVLVWLVSRKREPD